MKVPNNLILVFCQLEKIRQKKDYPLLIAENKMTRKTANENYHILKKLQTLTEIANQKGLQFDDIAAILEAQPDNQKKMF
jgi:hypothetical protein